MSDLRKAIADYARRKGTSLAPNWDAELGSDDGLGDADALERLCATLAWEAPIRLSGKPRADQFPLLCRDASAGQWFVVLHYRGEGTLAASGSGDVPSSLPLSEDLSFHVLALPDPLGATAHLSAQAVVWRAVMRHRQVLMTAGLATLVANILTLGTSLYSMQLFDRVIPLNSISTLIVLTVGVMLALMLDFVLRTLRATMIEREAAEVDTEISEYFFARAQAVRLDARPPGIGTMAAQLRGLDQVRSVMSSTTLFMLADLPFALFFIVVIAMLGGVVAIVPVLSLPVSLAIAFALGKRIRAATDRSQVSGNRKNGMLVEALDAAETVKANRGGWFMLGRWNRLVREVHHYDEPVKRLSAIASSLFGTMQQVAYVALMAVGALAVGEGKLTAGGLLACSILAGRINGPLVAMLPNLVVQWGYARSSLRALDAILSLPVDSSAGGSGTRPAHLAGAIKAEGISFAYPGARESLEIPSLELRPGERVAVIGGVGSGKTTLLRVLAGLYHSPGGRVLVGGLDLAQVADDIVRGHIGYLPQDFRLLNGSLRDNLGLGLDRIDDEAIHAAAIRTTLDQVIAGHPLGLDMQIQEGGRGLSGGQRSLVGITRLILATPQVWLLDEPTANLDQGAETAVLDAIENALPAGAILVMVTHKFQLLPRFGRVIGLQRGKIVLDGPANQVIANFTQGPAPAPAVVRA